MLKHTKRQVRYYKSQLYSAFVLSNVFNRSLRVIPIKTEMAKNQEHLQKQSNTTMVVSRNSLKLVETGKREEKKNITLKEINKRMQI